MNATVAAPAQIDEASFTGDVLEPVPTEIVVQDAGFGALRMRMSVKGIREADVVSAGSLLVGGVHADVAHVEVEQTVTVVGPRQRIIPNVRILGPVRTYSQVELSYTDGIYLGIELPLRISGNHDATPGCTILGPKGAVNLNRGVVRAERHVHMSTEDMAYYGIQDGGRLKLKIDGPCGVTFDNLVVRYHPKVILEVHIDTDEGNACDLDTATRMELIK